MALSTQHSSTALLLSSAILAVLASSLLFSTLRGGHTSSLRSLRTNPHLQQAAAVLPRLLAIPGVQLLDTPAQRDYRLGVLSQNLELIHKLNEQYEQTAAKEGREYDRTKPMYGPTPLSLLTQAEFESTHTGLNVPEQTLQSGEPPKLEDFEYAPLTATRKFEPKVRDQGNCGGCWAFAAVLTLEKLALETVGTQYDFSMQYLIDCDEENNGCSGGWPTLAYRFVVDQGVPLASYYPYEQKKNNCRPQNKVFRFGRKLRPLEFSFNLPIVNKLTSMGLYLGLAIYGGPELQLISSYNNDPWKPLACKSTGARKVSHAVTIVDSTPQYVVIQNSWTEYWGNRGFKKIIPCDPKEELFGMPSQVFSPVS